MSCPYYQLPRCECSAVEDSVTPSIYERERFCRSDAYKACPTHQLLQLRGSTVPEADYYALWLPPDSVASFRR